MLRGRRDRYHRLGFIIAFTVAAIATPMQMLRRRQLARWDYNNEPTKFAAIELVPKTASDVPETLFGHLNDDGTVSGGIAIPGLASILSDPSTGTRPRSRDSTRSRRAREPTTRQVNTVHLAWDVMVGIGTLLSLLAAWYGAVWLFRRRHPRRASGSCGSPRSPACSSVLAHGSGLGRDRGRAPAVDRVRTTSRSTQAATTNEGVWITFLVIAALYIGVAVTLVLDPARDEPPVPRAGEATSGDGTDAPVRPARRRSGRATASSRRWRAR